MFSVECIVSVYIIQATYEIFSAPHGPLYTPEQFQSSMFTDSLECSQHGVHKCFGFRIKWSTLTAEDLESKDNL